MVGLWCLNGRTHKELNRSACGFRGAYGVKLRGPDSHLLDARRVKIERLIALRYLPSVLGVITLHTVLPVPYSLGPSYSCQKCSTRIARLIPNHYANILQHIFLPETPRRGVLRKAGG